jgi:hypothetical protein
MPLHIHKLRNAIHGIHMAQSQALHPSMALGGIFMALFGSIWLAAADFQCLGGSLVALAGLLVIATGAIGLVAWARATFKGGLRAHAAARDPAAVKRLRRGFMLINAVQWIAVGLAVMLMNVFAHVEWIAPAVILIVGLHFVPLARLFGYRGYYVTAGALVLVALLDMLAGAEGHVALTLFATGAILWATTVALLRALKPNAHGQGATVSAA